MKKTILILFAVLFQIVHAQVFTLVDSIQYNQAQIWGVVSDDGDSLATTTTFTPAAKPHIYLRKGDYTDITQQSTPVQLTFDADFTSIPNITDHKSIIFNNEVYVAFSTIGDDDLFLFKTDINGNRIGSIVTVVSASTMDPTNDMMLVTDSTYIYVLHFDPTSQHRVYKFDTNLNPVASPFSTTTLAHNNIGNVLLHNSEFYMLTGSTFGFNANLILTRWDNSWLPTIGSPQNLVSSVGGDGNWFPTGMIWDEPNQRWYVGMSHIYSSETINQEHIDLLAFDASFNLLERIHTTAQGYYRPHFVLKNNYLYVSYDKSGMGVYLLKYQLENTVGIDESITVSNNLFVYPNPANDFVNVGFKNTITANELVLTDFIGRTLKRISLKEGEKEIRIDMKEFADGIYFIRDVNTGEVIKLIHQ